MTWRWFKVYFSKDIKSIRINIRYLPKFEIIKVKAGVFAFKSNWIVSITGKKFFHKTSGDVLIKNDFLKVILNHHHKNNILVFFKIVSCNALF